MKLRDIKMTDSRLEVEVPSENLMMRVLRRLLYSEFVKKRSFQGLWRRLYFLSLFAMNYGGGSCVDRSGEKWVLANVVAAACAKKTSPVIFDVGANVGDYSLSALSQIPQARIYAFEPSLDTFQILRSQIAQAEAQSHIFPENIGFSDTAGSVDLYSYAIDGYELSILSSLVKRLPTQEATIDTSRLDKVKVETIDDFCAARAIRSVDLLKIDVEGHEVAVLQGAKRMIDSRSIRLIQFEFGPANIYSRTYFYDFWEMLSPAYTIHRIVPQGIVPIDKYREQNEVFLTSNFLAISKHPTSDE